MDSNSKNQNPGPPGNGNAAKELELYVPSPEAHITKYSITEVKWLKWIDTFSQYGGYLGGILLPIAGSMIFYEVFMRYILRSPSTWVTEVSTYLIVASTMVSIAYTLKENAHIRVDWITSRFSDRTRIILDIVTSSLALIFCLYLFWEGLKLTIDSFSMGEKTSTVLRLPRFILLGFVPLGSLMISLQYLRVIPGLFETLHELRIRGDERSNVGGILVSVGFITVLVICLLLIKKATLTAAAILFIVFLFCGMPVSLALALFGMVGFIFYFGKPAMMSQLPLVTYGTLDSESLTAVPFYILCGIILVRGAMSVRLFEFVHVWVRHLPGGMAIASIMFCAIFACISGSSVATAATISLVALPEMMKRGYDRKFTLGLLAAGGTLGILIPPSIPMMIYGAMTETSVSQLFMAGFIPGFILAGMFIVWIIIETKRGKKNLPRGGNPSTWREKIAATKYASGTLTVPIIILGGIYSGACTPTEAAGVAMTYSFILCFVVYRSLSWSEFWSAMLETTKTSSMIMLLVVGANLSGQITAMMQVAQNILNSVLSFNLPPWLVIVFINIFLIILGMPLEAISILVITVPILFPLIVKLGFDPLWFGVIMVVNMELALISPPEGMNLFVLQSIGKSTTEEVSKGVIPFCLIMCLFLVVMCLFPWLATWLPGVLF